MIWSYIEGKVIADLPFKFQQTTEKSIQVVMTGLVLLFYFNKHIDEK